VGGYNKRKNSMILRRAFFVAVTTVHFPAHALEKITFYTDWKAQAEHGGFYQAKAAGLYKKYGLDVTIRSGGPQTDNTRLLAAGAIDIGMISNSFQAMTLAEKGADVKIVAAFFQKDPQVLMVHPGLKAWKISDLTRQPIFMDDAFRVTYFPWLKKVYGFQDRNVRKYAFSLTPWLQAPLSVQEGYLTSEPFTAEKAGVKPDVFILSDAGFTGYAAMVAVTGKALKAKPKVIAAFISASREGWTGYINGNPQAGNALIRSDNPDMTDALIANGRAQMIARGIVISGDAVNQGAGAMSAARWTQFYRDMRNLGIIGKDFNPAIAYDLRFVAPRQ
jgi:NitT/TauT family transport system substrate-binding protein